MEGYVGEDVGPVEAVQWWVHEHGRLKNCGSVILACTAVSSFDRPSQKYQTNRNDKWPVYLAIIQVRIKHGDFGRRRLREYVARCEREG